MTTLIERCDVYIVSGVLLCNVTSFLICVERIHENKWHIDTMIVIQILKEMIISIWKLLYKVGSYKYLNLA